MAQAPRRQELSEPQQHDGPFSGEPAAVVMYSIETVLDGENGDSGDGRLLDSLTQKDPKAHAQFPHIPTSVCACADGVAAIAAEFAVPATRGGWRHDPYARFSHVRAGSAPRGSAEDAEETTVSAVAKDVAAATVDPFGAAEDAAATTVVHHLSVREAVTEIPQVREHFAAAVDPCLRSLRLDPKALAATFSAEDVAAATAAEDAAAAKATTVVQHHSPEACADVAAEAAAVYLEPRAVFAVPETHERRRDDPSTVRESHVAAAPSVVLEALAAAVVAAVAEYVAGVARALAASGEAWHRVPYSPLPRDAFIVQLPFDIIHHLVQPSAVDYSRAALERGWHVYVVQGLPEGLPRVLLLDLLEHLGVFTGTGLCCVWGDEWKRITLASTRHARGQTHDCMAAHGKWVLAFRFPLPAQLLRHLHLTTLSMASGLPLAFERQNGSVLWNLQPTGLIIALKGR